jgi:hypothetical protein
MIWFAVSLQKDSQVMAKDVLSIEKRICINETLDADQRAKIEKLEVVLEQISLDISEIKGYLKPRRNIP